MYTRADFRTELLAEMRRGFDAVRIARWSYQTYLRNVHQLEPGLKDKIRELVLMEEGPQFAKTELEVLAFAEQLQN